MEMKDRFLKAKIEITIYCPGCHSLIYYDDSDDTVYCLSPSCRLFNKKFKTPKIKLFEKG